MRHLRTMTGTTKAPAGFHSELRDRVAKSFTLVEDVVYVGLGVMLAGAGVVLLVSLVVDFLRSLFGGRLPSGVIGVLDQVLLILMPGRMRSVPESKLARASAALWPLG